MCVQVACVYSCWNNEAVHLALQNVATIQLGNNPLQDFSSGLEKERFSVSDLSLKSREVLTFNSTDHSALEFVSDGDGNMLFGFAVK